MFVKIWNQMGKNYTRNIDKRHCGNVFGWFRGFIFYYVSVDWSNCIMCHCNFWCYLTMSGLSLVAHLSWIQFYLAHILLTSIILDTVCFNLLNKSIETTLKVRYRWRCSKISVISAIFNHICYCKTNIVNRKRRNHSFSIRSRLCSWY